MVKNITANDVKRMKDSKEDVVIIDVLSPESFANRHLPGAINVPLENHDFKTQVQQKVPDKSTPVVTYCTDEDCQLSPKAAKKMEQMGYEKIHEFEGGLVGWRRAGYELEGTAQQIRADS